MGFSVGSLEQWRTRRDFLRAGLVPRTGWMHLCWKPLHKRLRHTRVSAQAFPFAQWSQGTVGKVGDEGNSLTYTTVSAVSESGDWGEEQEY